MAPVRCFTLIVIYAWFHCVQQVGSEQDVHWDVPLAADDLARLLRGDPHAGGDASSRAYAAKEIIRRGISALALREVFDHADWESARRYVGTLLPSEAPEGNTLMLMSWLRRLAMETTKRSMQTDAEIRRTRVVAAHGSSCALESQGRRLRAVSEADAAAAVKGLPISKRFSALRECLFSDYDMEAQPDNPVVEIGVNFFKITELDLRSSVLSMPVWMRLEWTDSRLVFNSSLWDLDTLSIYIDSNSLENTRLWSPDIELYNSETSLGSSLAWKQASLDSSGKLFWSRPGMLKSLCKFKGLGLFPLDALSCTLEFGAWSLDMVRQDVQLRARDGGIHFYGKSSQNSDVLSTSPTAGSTYQIYTIQSVTAERAEVRYDCCSHPFAVVSYLVEIARGDFFYTMKLIVPQICMAGLSLITYFMDAAIGERLGFGITLVLAVIATDIVATEFMPVCDEILLMNYINWLSLLFCVVALFESGLVLSIYYLDVLDLQELLPSWLRSKSLKSKSLLLTKLLQQTTSSLSASFSHQSSVESMQLESDDGERSNDQLPGTPQSVPKPRGPKRDVLESDALPPESSPPTLDVTGVVPPSSILQIDPNSPPLNVMGVVPSSIVQEDTESPEAGLPPAFRPKRETSNSNSSFRPKRETSNSNSCAPLKAGSRSRTNAEGLGSIQSTNLRLQLYREAFYILDDDFSGRLERKEVDSFGRYMMGADWTAQLLDNFMLNADKDCSGGLTFDEFANFCESHILSSDSSKSPAYVGEMVKGFMSLTNTRREMVKQKWHAMAHNIDRFFRGLMFISMVVTYTILLLVYPATV